MSSRAARLALVLVLACAPGAAAQQAAGVRDVIASIASGADTAGRRLAITKQLDASGVTYRLDEFSIGNFSGTNIVADVPARTPGKVLLLGAHYDRVPEGHGALDNAASCAVLLQLLADFKAKPLEHYSIKAVFFDLEERGLVGSQAYFVNNREPPKPALALNMDIFGYGDAFFATASSETGVLAGALQRAAAEVSWPVRLTPPSQYPASDHRIMIAAGIETVGLALIDGAEIDAIVQHAGPEPRILSIIHTPADAIDKINSADIERAFPIVERTIRLVDSQ